MTSGLLVRHIPAQCPRAALYDHFTDPQHGGGPVDYLLFPLGADASRALVVFSDHKVLPRVLLPTHRVHGQVLKVAPAPRQTFASCTAEVDPLLLASLDDPEAVLSSLAADCGVDILRDPVRLSGSFLQIQTAQAGLDAEFQRAHAAQQRELLMVGKRPRHARSPHRSRRHVYDSSTTDDELGNQSLPAMYLRTSAAVKTSPQGISGQKAAWPEPQGRSSPIISDSEGVPDKKARSVVASDSSLVVDDQIVPLSDQSAEEGDLIQAVQMATTESAPPKKSKSRSRSSSATSAHGFTDKEVTSDPNSGKSYILLELDHYVVTYMRKIQQRKIKAVEADNEVKVSYKACGDLSEVLIQPVDPSRPSQRRLEAAQAGLVSVYQALFYSVVKETVALAPAALPAEVYEAVMSAVRKAFSQTVVFQENLSQGEIVIIGGWSHVSVAADWIREKFGLQRTGADAKKKPKSAGSLDLSTDSQKMRLIMDLSPTRKAVSKEEAKALVQQRKDDLTKERERRSVDTRFTQSMPAASASDLQAEASRILAQTQPVQYDADMSDCGSTDGGPVIVQSQLVEAHSKARKARKPLDADTSDKESQHSQVLSPRQDVSSPRASDILSASRHSDVVSPEPAFDDPILPMNSLLTSKAPSKTAAAENYIQSPRGSGITSPRPDDYLSPRGSGIASTRPEDLQSPRGSGIISPRPDDYLSPRGSAIASPIHEDYFSPRGSGITSPRHENFLSPRGSAIGSPRPEDYKSPRGSGLLSPRLDDFLSPRGTTDHNWWEVFSFTTNQGLTVKICNGDLTVAKVDAIVSAANERLENIGGVARAISKVVGSTYEDSCLEHVTKYGYLQVSEVVGLPVRCDRSWSNVLQAYGPMWALYTDKDQCAMVLKDTFLNAFKYADTVLQIRSLATPAISAGVFGVPLDVCARAMFDALHSFSRSQTSSSSVREVVIVNLDEETTNVISAIFQQLLEAANQSGGYESDTSSFFKDVETDKQDDDGELDDLIKANTQTEAFSAPRASRRESDEEEDYESESDVPAITRGDVALTHSALRTTSKKSETKGFEDIFEKELDEDGGLNGAKHSPMTSVKDLTSPRTSGKDATSPRDSMKDISSPRGSVRESLKDITSPRESLRDITSPRDSVRDITSPRDSVRDITSPRDSVRDITSPRDSVRDITSPRDSVRDITSPRDSVRDITSPRDSVRDITSPRDSVRDITSPRESVRNITSPRDSVRDITSPRDSVRDITSPRDSVRDITSPRESVRDITSPRDSVRDITSPRESFKDVTSPRNSVRDITSPRDSVRDVTSPRDSVRDVTSPRDSVRDATSPRDSVRDVTSPRTSVRDVTSPRNSVRDVTSPRTSVRDVTSTRNSVRDVTSPRDSVRDVTSPRTSVRDVTSPRNSVRDVTSPRDSVRDVTSPRTSVRDVTSPRTSVRDITSPRNSVRDVTSPRDSVRDVTSPRDSVRDVTSPRTSVRDVTSPRNSVRDVTSPRDSVRDLTSPRNSVRDVTSPRTSVRDVTSPRNSVRDVTSPRDSFRDVTSPRDSVRDVTYPRDSVRDVTSPRTSVRDVTSPRTSVRDVTSPRNSVRDVTSPRDSVRDVTSPRTSVRDVTSPRNSVRGVTSPRTSVRDVTSPRSSIKDLTSPRNSSRDVTSPRASIEDVTSPRNSDGGHSSRREQDLTSPRTSHKDITSPRSPRGPQMKCEISRGTQLAGESSPGAVIVRFSFPDHEDVVSYLPNTPAGRELIQPLRRAHEAGLAVRVNDAGDVVSGDLELKANTDGGADSGYPDPDYVSRLRAQLSALGFI